MATYGVALNIYGSRWVNYNALSSFYPESLSCGPAGRNGLGGPSLPVNLIGLQPQSSRHAGENTSSATWAVSLSRGSRDLRRRRCLQTLQRRSAGLTTPSARLSRSSGHPDGFRKIGPQLAFLSAFRSSTRMPRTGPTAEPDALA